MKPSWNQQGRNEGDLTKGVSSSHSEVFDGKLTYGQNWKITEQQSLSYILFKEQFQMFEDVIHRESKEKMK